jgi:hypothetical protein
MIEVVLTKDFIENAYRAFWSDRATFDQTRLILWAEHNYNSRVLVGSKMVLTCGNETCVDPEHVEMIPPVTN